MGGTVGSLALKKKLPWHEAVENTTQGTCCYGRQGADQCEFNGVTNLLVACRWGPASLFFWKISEHTVCPKLLRLYWQLWKMCVFFFFFVISDVSSRSRTQTLLPVTGRWEVSLVLQRTEEGFCCPATCVPNFLFHGPIKQLYSICFAL